MLDAYVFRPVEEDASDADEDSYKNFEIRFPDLVQHQYKINMQDEMENLLDSFLREVGGLVLFFSSHLVTSFSFVFFVSSLRLCNEN